MTVVLIGTDHTFQLPVKHASAAGTDAFRVALLELRFQHAVCAIAEEMDSTVLEEKGVPQSVAQQVCDELHLIHQFSDPNLAEREQLGIDPEGIYGVRAQGWKNGWTEEQIDAVISRDYAPDEKREREWLRRIQGLNKSPVLFICGANHITSFASLLRKNGIDVVVAFTDWVPNSEQPSPLIIP